MSPAGKAADETATWFGGSGNWSDASKWTDVPVLVAFPNDGNLGKTYDAVVNTGAITLDQDISIQALTFNGGPITGGNVLTLSGTSTWKGGTISGTGTTRVGVGGSLTFGLGSVDTMSGGETLEVAGAVFEDASSLAVSGSGAGIKVMSGGSLALRGNSLTYSGPTPGTLNVLAGGTLTRSGTTYAQSTVSIPFNNAGTVTVTQGTLATSSSAPFINTGAVTVQAGQLYLSGGGSSSGPFTIANGANLTFAGDYSFLPGSSITSGASSSIAMNTGTLTLSTDLAASNLSFTGGLITGGNLLTLSGANSWGGGTMSGTGTTRIPVGASLGVPLGVGVTLSGGRTLEIGGSVTNDASSLAVSGAGSAVNVLSGGSLALRGNSVTYSGPTPGTLNVLAGGTLTRSNTSYMQTTVSIPFNNAGTVTVAQGTLATTSTAPFVNAGTVTVQAGQLYLSGGGSSSGPFTIADGANLTLAGDYALQPGSSIASGASSSIAINTGTLTLSTDIAASNLTFSGGLISGGSLLTLAGANTWSGGTMSGTGTTRIPAGATLAIPLGVGVTLNGGRTLAVAGAVTDDASSLAATGTGTAVNVVSGGSLALRGNSFTYSGPTPGSLNVLAGGTLTRSNSTAYTQTTLSVPLNNAGSVTVAQGTLATNSTAPFNNTGAVSIQAGQLYLAGGGSSSGPFMIANGANLTLAGDYSFLPGSSIASGASSSIAVTTGTLSLSTDIAASNLTFSGGTITGGNLLTLAGATTWSGGTMSGTATTRIVTGASLAVPLGVGVTLSGGRTLEIAGTVTDDASSLAITGAGSAVNVLAGGSLPLRGNSVTYSGPTPGALNVLAGGTVTRSNSSAYTQSSVSIPLNNAGSVTVAQGTLATTSTAPFNNTGTVSIQAGQLYLAGGGTSSGSFTIANGANLTLAGDYSLLPGSSISSGASSSISLTTGTLTLSTDIAAANLSFTGGLITGGSLLTLSGSNTWNAGTMSGTGTTRIAGGAGLTVPLGVGVTLSGGRTLEVVGTMTSEASSLAVVGTGAALNVLSGGSLTLRGNQVSYNGPTPGSVNVLPGGTLTRSGTNYTQTTLFVPLNNNGLTTVNQGTLAISGGGSASGTFNVAAGATLIFNSDYSLAAGARLDGAGTYTFSGSRTLTLNGNTTVVSSLSLSGVTINGPGDLNVQGNINYAGGSVAGSGALAIAPTASMTLAGPADASFARRLDNNGTLSWTGGRVVLTDAPINNLAGAVFTTSAANSIVAGGAGTNAAVNNAGQFSKTSGSITIFAVPFNNQPTGTVDVLAGTLVLSGGGMNQGAITIEKGATGRLSGNFVQVPGSTFNSLGNVAFDAATITIDGNLMIDGDLSFSTATATIKGGVTATKLALVNSSASIAAGGVLQVNAGGVLFSGSNSVTVTLQPSDTTPGSFLLKGDVSFTATDGTAALNTANFGVGQTPGLLDLGNATRTFSVNDGLAATDLAVSARITNGSILKTGAGTLRLDSPNAITGVTTISAGTLEVTDPAALGTGGVVLGDATLSLKSDIAAPPVFASSISVGGDATIRVDHLTAGANGQFRVGPVSIGGTRLTVGGANRSLAIAGLAMSGSPTIDTAQPLLIDGTISQSAAGLGVTKSGGTAKLTFGGLSANTYTGPTRVNAGTLELNKPAGVVAVPGDLQVFGGSVKLLADGQLAATSNVSVANPGTLLDLGGHPQTLASLSVSGNASMTVGANGITPLRVNGAFGVTTGGKLDLANNKLIVDYDPAAGASPLASIRAALVSGYAGGAWNGAAGIDSAGISATRSLGYAEASDVLGAGGGKFGGQDVDGSAVLVAYTLAGDANLDGSVDFLDLARLAQGYNTTLSSPTTVSTWLRGDFDYNGNVDFNDLAKLAQNYNTTLPGGGATVPGAPAGFEADLARAFASVPEPSSLVGVIGLGLFVARGRRRRRRDHLN
jgi:autotransporter-associated beta strand protein